MVWASLLQVRACFAMANRVTVQDKRNNWDKLQKDLQKLAGRSHVTIGLHASEGSELLQYANVHEFGLTIPAHQVTTHKRMLKGADKRTAFDRNGNKRRVFSNKGRFVKANSKHANFAETFTVKAYKMPERSFIRSYYDKEFNNLAAFAEKQFLQVIMRGLPLNAAFERIGLKAQRDIKAGIKNGVQLYGWKPSKKTHQPALAKKYGTRTMIYKSHLINGVKYEIQK